MNLAGQKKCTRRKTCPSVNLSTINLSRSDLGSKLGLRDDRSTINRLNYGTASSYVLNVIHVYKLGDIFTVNNERVHKNDVPLNAGTPNTVFFDR